MLDISGELKYIRDEYYCRVIILYANKEDAEHIFDEIRFQGMNEAGYVWIVSEQVAKIFKII